MCNYKKLLLEQETDVTSLYSELPTTTIQYYNFMDSIEIWHEKNISNAGSSTVGDLCLTVRQYQYYW